jgi:hypothetical protein
MEKRSRGRRAREVASLQNRANLVATIMLAPPAVQEWAMEEMRQMVACQRPCKPVAPTASGLRAELIPTIEITT